MAIRFHSLRARLTLLYALIFGLLQSGFWITVDVVRSHYLHEHFDKELLGRARSVVGAIESASESTLPFLREQFQKDALKQFAAESLFIQVTLVSQEVIGQTKNLTGARLPLSPEARRDALRGIPAFETMDGPTSTAIAGMDSSLRSVVLSHKIGNNLPVLLQVATDLRPVSDVLNRLRRFVVIYFIVSMTLSTFTSWHLVGRSLAPVGRIVRQAKRITASRLHERIPVPKDADEIGEMVRVLNEMLDRLQSQFRNQRQFLSNISHELKTPITVLLAEARSHANLSDPEVVEEFRCTVVSESERLLRIVDAFLLLTRVGSGGTPAVLVRTPLEDIVLNAMKACESEAEAKRIRLIPTLKYDDVTPHPVIAGDSDLLYSMLENIIRNGVRHTPEGGTLQVEAAARIRDAVISVRDQGPGVPREQLNRIFEPFFQVQLDADGNHSGLLGIGLSISRAIAELHGGSISCKNLNDGGCEFAVHLPIESDGPPRGSH